jgi:2-polyprenyl-3-methyl-5-hydroxy-6-metoxy-1,4-benzoquinol methylase
MSVIVTCEICSHSETSDHLDLRLDVYKCPKCGHLAFLKELKDSTNDGEEFERFISAQNQDFESKRIYNTARKLSELIDLKGEPKARIFDIGCGSGEFLSIAKKMDFEVYGCEISLEAVNFCKSRNLENVSLGKFEDLDFVRKFHAITMFCVLAHVVEIRTLLKSIQDNLTPGGILYFHTPAYCSIDLLALKGARWGVPFLGRVLIRRVNREHKRIFTVQSLRELLSEYKFEIIEINQAVGFGLKKRFYFQQIGFPQAIAFLLEKVTNILEKLNLLPKNVFYVYARSVSTL